MDRIGGKGERVGLGRAADSPEKTHSIPKATTAVYRSLFTGNYPAHRSSLCSSELVSTEGGT